MRLFLGGGWRDAFTWACLSLALSRAEAVSASTFRVSPVQVTLSSTTPSALLTVGNDGDEPLRFQVSAFTWDQDNKGRMRLTPTQDIVFFPMMLTVDGHDQRRIRVGSTLAAGANEKTYRIFIEELPPLSASAADAGKYQIKVLTKFGIPVFVQPLRPTTEPTVEFRGVSDDNLHIAIRNLGNTHLMLQTVHLHGIGADGAGLIDRESEGWYVLAGGERDYDQPLSASECASLKSLAVDAETDKGPIAGRIDVPASTCDSFAASTASLKTN